MRKIISSLFIITFIALFLSSCKRPEQEKISIQQTIETPVMQMAEPPSEAQGAVTAGKEALPPAETAVPTAETPAVPSSPTLINVPTNIEIIIDASGSMNAPMGTTTKIGAVKSALKEIISAPLSQGIAGRKMAIRTFGSKSPGEKNDCSDTSLDLPMGKHDIQAFAAAVEKIGAQGISPMAFALEETYKDFAEPSDNADSLVILIADGMDSCNGDAAAAVERLHKGPAKAIVDVIGFDVDQNTQDLLKRLASAGSGTFYLARSPAELATALDQAVSANLPYNLRVKVMSGATPVPSIITIFRANTQSVVDRSDSPGFKFFKLLPGTYDIHVEYRESIESTKPSKIIKGVEVTNTSKAEQVVQFELGNINIVMTDQSGKGAASNIYLRRAGTEEVIGRLLNVPSPQMVHISPGVYDIDAETVEGPATLTAQAKNVEVKSGETAEQVLKFQTGRLSLKAQNVSKEQIPISYRVTRPESEEVIASGEGALDGVVVDLPPGNYDVYVEWKDPNVIGAPEVKLPNVTISGGETLEQLATIVTGTLKLSGKDSHGKYVHTEFTIRKAGRSEELIKAVSDDAPVDVLVAPGAYDIIATNTTSKVIPPPSVAWETVAVKEGGTQNLEAVFKLGSIKLIGKNAKEQTIPTTFTVFRGGTDEPIVVEESERSWVTFNLTPGFYDIKAEDKAAKGEPKPSIWFHDVAIKEGETITNEAIFTSGKLKVICRGKNNLVLTCEFNVFTYGSDTALFSGTTAEEWREFDIPPGKYYMEAGWHDPTEEQFLKKWINVEIGENQIVEQVLRF